MTESQQQKNNKDKFFQKYAKGALHSHSVIAPFGLPSTCNSLVALHFPIFR